ncbi:MAG: hypothetical protein RLY69_280 [Verrucomicrobiota bacterium]
MKRADHHLVQQVLDGEISREGFDQSNHDHFSTSGEFRRLPLQ